MRRCAQSFAGCPAQELIARHDELARRPRFEAQAEWAYERQQEHVAERQRNYAEAVARCEAVEDLGWRERRQELPVRRGTRADARRTAARGARRDSASWRRPSTEARREREIAGQVLAEREEQGFSPPASRLRPTSSRSWARGPPSPRRRRHGIVACGRSRATAMSTASPTKTAPSGRGTRTARSDAPMTAPRIGLREAQRRLDLSRKLERSMQRSRGDEPRP